MRDKLLGALLNEAALNRISARVADSLDESHKRTHMALVLAVHADDELTLVANEMDESEVTVMSQQTQDYKMGEPGFLSAHARAFSERTGAAFADALQEMCRRHPGVEPTNVDEACFAIMAREGVDIDEAMEKSKRLYPVLWRLSEEGQDEDQPAEESRFFKKAAELSVRDDLDIKAAELILSYHEPELFSLHVQGEPKASAGDQFGLTDPEQYPHLAAGAERQPSTRPIPNLNAQQQKYWARRARQHVETEFQKLGLNIGSPYFGYDVLEDIVAEALQDGFADRLSADTALLKTFRQKCPSHNFVELHLALCEAKSFIRREFFEEVDAERKAARYVS